MKTYELDKKIKQKGLEVGLSSSYDADLSKVRYQNASNNNIFYDYKMKNILEEINKNYNINIDSSKDTLSYFKTLDLNIEDKEFENINNKSIKNAELNIKKTAKEVDYIQKDTSMPSINTGINYDIESKEPYVTIGFSKIFGKYNDDLETKKVELEEYKNIYNEAIAAKEVSISKAKTEYAELLKDYYNLNRDMELSKKQYEIYKVREETGLSTYSDRIEKYQEYENAILLFNKKKNELIAYKYKIMYQD